MSEAKTKLLELLDRLIKLKPEELAKLIDEMPVPDEATCRMYVELDRAIRSHKDE